MKENMEISLEEYKNIEETLARLVCPKAKMVQEGCNVYYVFSRKEYELLETHMRIFRAAAREVFINTRRDLNGYASLCAKDDKLIGSIKDTLDKTTIVLNSCEDMSNDLLMLLDKLPCRVKDDSKVYTRMPVSTYRIFMLACVGYYAEMEWTRNAILRGDWEWEVCCKDS
jgi:hypothetical protein